VSEDELAQNCLTLGGLAPGVGLQFEATWRGFEYDLELAKLNYQTQFAMNDLLTPLYDRDKLHSSFVKLLDPRSEPARTMIENIFHDFEDPDGNFVEQFQTAGFDARLFELYLFAYFTRSGFEVARPRPNPDFLATLHGVEVAVEATTVNPSTSGTLATHGKRIADLDESSRLEYIQNELAVRFGSPLASKMQNRYWELPHCVGKPFVIAIEAFYEEDSLTFSDTALSRYVYGLEQSGTWTESGDNLEITASSVQEHVIGPKVVPSGLFSHPASEFLSGVLFTNSGTHAKFSRMGYQTGYGTADSRFADLDMRTTRTRQRATHRCSHTILTNLRS
jgi:hypothetical protein